MPGSLTKSFEPNKIGTITFTNQLPTKCTEPGLIWVKWAVFDINHELTKRNKCRMKIGPDCYLISASGWIRCFQLYTSVKSSNQRKAPPPLRLLTSVPSGMGRGRLLVCSRFMWYSCKNTKLGSIPVLMSLVVWVLSLRELTGRRSGDAEVLEYENVWLRGFIIGTMSVTCKCRIYWVRVSPVRYSRMIEFHLHISMIGVERIGVWTVIEKIASQ